MSVPQAAVQLSGAYPQKSSSFMGRLANIMRHPTCAHQSDVDRYSVSVPQEKFTRFS